ncbi:MAG: tRNA (adenosine(37)-N6)-threonylcarbamoyltransferase complex ATPase subunit type 1 TsaE [Bacteroidota bacterium]|jgi:tRNA threonylcarbamoyladenosine biosynthesis protein TsaE
MTSEFIKIIQNEDDLENISFEILNHCKDIKKFTLSGELGAGKTTLIKSICKKLGAIENLSSPSFSIINEYKTGTGEYIYHMDLYRIKNKQELLEIGFDEYIYSDEYCFIEWPEIAKDYLPEKYVDLKIKVLKDNKRELKIIVIL